MPNFFLCHSIFNHIGFGGGRSHLLQLVDPQPMPAHFYYGYLFIIVFIAHTFTNCIHSLKITFLRCLGTNHEGELKLHPNVDQAYSLSHTYTQTHMHSCTLLTLYTVMYNSLSVLWSTYGLVPAPLGIWLISVDTPANSSLDMRTYSMYAELSHLPSV